MKSSPKVASATTKTVDPRVVDSQISSNVGSTQEISLIASDDRSEDTESVGEVQCVVDLDDELKSTDGNARLEGDAKAEFNIGQVIEVSVTYDGEDEENWLPAIVMAIPMEGEQTFHVRLLGYDDEIAYIDVDLEFLRDIPDYVSDEAMLQPNTDSLESQVEVLVWNQGNFLPALVEAITESGTIDVSL